MYGEQADGYSVAFKQTAMKLQWWVQHVTGGTATAALAKAKVQITLFIAKMAFVQAVDDVFLIAGGVLLLSILPLFLIRSSSRQSLPAMKAAAASAE